MSNTTMHGRWLSGVLLFAAFGLTLAALLLFFVPADEEQEVLPLTPSNTATPSLTPTITLTPLPSPSPSPTVTATPLATADADSIATSIAQPLTDDGTAVRLARSESPYTINPAPQRSEIVTHVVQRGETVNDIATRYNLEDYTLIWSNRRFYHNALQVGFEMTILPFDGALHVVQQPLTIAELAEQYLVEPYAIIDSDFNDLRDANPEHLLPPGLRVVIPGGTGAWEPLYYEPPNSVYANVESSGSGLTRIYNGEAVFGEGQPGSCGVQPIYGGGMPTTLPTRGYVLTNDYTSAHPGVDLAGRMGDPVYAVGSGTVIFRGWSTWGYGYTVVVAHGPVMSLYAHLSEIDVWCGQVVEGGQRIGGLGNSGNSSGPHVHFEIRNVSGTRENPHSYLGW